MAYSPYELLPQSVSFDFFWFLCLFCVQQCCIHLTYGWKVISVLREMQVHRATRKRMSCKELNGEKKERKRMDPDVQYSIFCSYVASLHGHDDVNVFV